MCDAIDWNTRWKVLDTMAQGMRRTTPVSELYKLNLEHRGILVAFWRHHYPQDSNFVEWLSKMEAKDDNFKRHEPQPRQEKQDVPSEDIVKKLKEIEEKYGSIQQKAMSDM